MKGRSVEEIRDKVNSHVEIDTEEMIKWRSLSQGEIDQCWKNWEKNEAEVVDKCKIEESKREAFKDRGAPLEWRRVRKNKRNRIRRWKRRLLGKSLLFVRRV